MGCAPRGINVPPVRKKACLYRGCTMLVPHWYHFGPGLTPLWHRFRSAQLTTKPRPSQEDRTPAAFAISRPGKVQSRIVKERTETAAREFLFSSLFPAPSFIYYIFIFKMSMDLNLFYK